MGFDVVALLLVLWLSYSLRLGTRFVPDDSQLALMALAPIVALPIFVRMGLYRAVIRYLPERAIWTIFWAMTQATLIWLAILFFAEITRVVVLPRSIPVFYWMFGLIVISGSRFAAKALLWSPIRKAFQGGEVFIYGAGSAGRELAMALRAQGSQYVAGFLDDDKALQGRDVLGIPVHAPQHLDKRIGDFGETEVLLSIPSISTERRRQIFNDLSKHEVKIRTLPAISDLASGKYLVGELREIDIDDLLGRSSVPPDPNLLREMVAHKVILISGGGGSIGSELAKLVVKWAPRKLVILEANEFVLYQIERVLKGLGDLDVIPVLGSITDATLVARTLRRHGVQVVFHAAAHKHVPLVEANVLEGVRNNVFGTQTLARAALDGGVESFVLISSDKAVRPTNVMGATKRWAELIVGHCGAIAKSEDRNQRFCAVRFGNVLGSNGSVVPLFKEQIADGGPVTLTDDRMTRYFMSIHEAAELIVQAGALSEGDDIFLLEMGEPVRVRDLAENMIRLAGLTVRDDNSPAGDIEISTIGLRPGEKLYEELFYDTNNVDRTIHPKILRAVNGAHAHNDVESALEELRQAFTDESEPEVRRILFEFIQKDNVDGATGS
ncbi:nucleoside-diphosphate sugar epimerase/dehydratase [Devosia rhodophyticola]|uniref:Nucleoside-diphosphate sugar epimerase/dehydratase n=1 Tax=Devosia rhodophyticola TaxID=3026423 RepID=A0ABY7YYL9_9HYPH|nr:nucleoside-diphosphate sugar epimerase/dehydratase [Devosia rhodophyticola]WDR05880.1 nucleoside-diphosphate sugar epimerase/dehydratase [Devosia rhodophyticola]